MNKIDELKKLKDLLDNGLITQEEFKSLKAEILENNSSRPIGDNQEKVKAFQGKKDEIIKANDGFQKEKLEAENIIIKEVKEKNNEVKEEEIKNSNLNCKKCGTQISKYLNESNNGLCLECKEKGNQIPKIVYVKLLVILVLSVWLLKDIFNTDEQIPINTENTSEFNRLKNERYNAVNKNLEEIKKAQIAHYTVTGQFQSDWDNLIKFIETEKFTIIDRRDSTVLDREMTLRQGRDVFKDIIINDTLYFYSVRDSLFGEADTYKNMMYYPVGSKDLKFELTTDFIHENELKLPIFKVKAMKDNILYGLDKALISKEKETGSGAIVLSYKGEAIDDKNSNGDNSETPISSVIKENAYNVKLNYAEESLNEACKDAKSFMFTELKARGYIEKSWDNPHSNSSIYSFNFLNSNIPINEFPNDFKFELKLKMNSVENNDYIILFDLKIIENNSDWLFGRINKTFKGKLNEKPQKILRNIILSQMEEIDGIMYDYDYRVTKEGRALPFKVKINEGVNLTEDLLINNIGRWLSMNANNGRYSEDGLSFNPHVLKKEDDINIETIRFLRELDEYLKLKKLYHQSRIIYTSNQDFEIFIID